MVCNAYTLKNNLVKSPGGGHPVTAHPYHPHGDGYSGQEDEQRAG